MRQGGDGDGRRVEALNGYGVLDTPNEPEFDRIVQDAAAVLGAPIALISLLDSERQWFKAKVGLDATETPRSISFCTHAIRGTDVFVVPDAREDKLFADNPLVTGDPGIRFYAGAPLTAENGRRIGTICVIDTKPRRALNASESAYLAELATRTMAALADRQRRPK